MCYQCILMSVETIPCGRWLYKNFEVTQTQYVSARIANKKVVITFIDHISYWPRKMYVDLTVFSPVIAFKRRPYNAVFH